MKFQGSKLEITLIPQSPMIHFQSGETGATLRPTEVKPKLDRYILRHLQNETSMTLQDLKGDPIYKDIFILPKDKESDDMSQNQASNDALKYKMRIACKKSERIDLSNYRIFYGNVGNNRDSDENVDHNVYAIKAESRMTIQCFNEELRRIIEKHIIPFFIVTNFGRMQNKGFGSFLPSEAEIRDLKQGSDQECKIVEFLKTETGSKECYCMRFNTKQKTKNGLVFYKGRVKYSMDERIFEEIRAFYSIMKSGQNHHGYARSYIYHYMHNEYKVDEVQRNTNNEKAWMKQNRIVPAVSKPENKGKHDLDADNARYVRAMLGIGESLTYRYTGRLQTIENGVRMNGSSLKVSIKHNRRRDEEKIERMASPIFFKVIKDVVYIVANRIPYEIMNKKFEFSSSVGRGEICTLASFDIDDFLSKYVGYYNGDLRREITNLEWEVRNRNPIPYKKVDTVKFTVQGGESH